RRLSWAWTSARNWDLLCVAMGLIVDAFGFSGNVEKQGWPHFKAMPGPWFGRTSGAIRRSQVGGALIPRRAGTFLTRGFFRGRRGSLVGSDGLVDQSADLDRSLDALIKLERQHGRVAGLKTVSHF